MLHPLVEKIMREGPASVDVSKVSPALRLKLMTDAGDALLRMGRAADAAHCYALAENAGKLRETADWFLEKRDFAAAAHFLSRVGSRDELERLAQQCTGIGEIAAAKEIYAGLGDEKMVRFLEENFGK